MSIAWGSAIGNNASTGDMKLGVSFEQIPAAVDSSTTAVTMRAHFWIWTKWSVSDSSNTFSVWGSWPSQSFAVSVSTSNNSTWSEANIQYLGYRDVSINLALGVAQQMDIGVSLTGIDAAPGTAQTVLSPAVWAPARPYAVPSAPQSASVARVSDAQHTVSWVRAANASTDQYTWLGVKIERWDNVGGAWVQVATVTGTGASWSDTGTVANRRYQYRVRSYNSAGNSGYATSSTIDTTPAAPTGASAVRSGMDIALAWANPSLYGVVQIYDAPAGGTLVLVAELAVGSTSYTHVTPEPTQTHTYSIRTAIGALTSGYSTTGTVQLQTAPAAPTGLAPVGSAYDATEGIDCSWVHNPLDSSPQSAYELFYREVGAGEWSTTGKVTSGTSSRTLTGLLNAKSYEWKVKTWGADAASSPDSAVASFATSARPTLVLTVPAYDNVEHVTPYITVEHTYSDAEAKAQSAHKTVLKQGSTVLWQKTTTGAGLTEAVPIALADGGFYTIEKQVQDGDGLWSAVLERSFTVDYLEPVTPVVTLEYDSETGSVLVIIANPVGEGGEPDVTYNEVWRRVDDGALELVATEVPPGGAVIDRLPGLSNVNTYLVRAFSAMPSMSEGSASFETDGLAGWVWLNSGSGYGASLRFRLAPKFSDSFGRQGQAHRFAGRKHPVLFTGEAVEDTVAISGVLETDADSETARDVLEWSGPVCYRDPRGRRFFAKVEGPKVSRQPYKAPEFSATMVRVESPFEA